MNKEEEYFEHINRFLDGKMTSVEENEFKERLETEGELKSEFELYTSLNDLVIDYKLLNVKNELAEIHRNQSSSGFTKYGRPGIVSLIILVTGLAVYWNFQSNNKANSEEVDTGAQSTINAQLEKAGAMETLESFDPESSLDESIGNPQTDIFTANNKGEKISDKSPNVSGINYRTIDNTVEESDSISFAKVSGSNINRDIEDSNLAEDITSSSELVKSNPCSKTQIKFDIKVRDACLPEQNGEIVIDGIEGGKGPYQILFENTEIHYSKIENLGHGSYRISVSDMHGCLQSSEVKVNEEFCQKDFEINPNFGQVVIFPEYSSKGKLTIYDRAGKVMYESEVDEFRTFEWNGQLKNGEISSGYYVFIIQYEDGKLYQGSVTITQ